MLNVLETVSCGGMTFDAILPNLVSYAVTAIKIIIPVVLVVLGMLDMGKAVIGNDEKAMKENQNKLIKRCVYAVLIFLIVAIVQAVFGVLDQASTDGTSGATSCINCFINGADSCTQAK